MVRLDVALEPSFWPTVELHHRRELLAAEGNAAQDKMFEPKLAGRGKKVVQKRSCGAAFSAAVNKVPDFGIEHARDPRL
jgi:cytochrome c5